MSNPYGAAIMLAGALLTNALLPVPRWSYLDRIKRREEKRLAREGRNV